jgi:peptidoglycan/LPS O-acetylase OafA/YrhL
MQFYNTSFHHSISECRASIMGVAILSIMLFHQYFTSIFPFNLFHNFGYWGVDVFLLLSGMGIVNSLEKHDVCTFYKRRFMRIIPICALCGTIKYSIFLLLGDSVTPIKDGLHIGPWSIVSLDLWFIHAIIILYAISPILYLLLKKRPIITFACILLISLCNSLTLLSQIGYEWFSLYGITAWTLERLPVFTLGMWLSIEKKFNKRKILISISFLLTAFIIKIISKIDETSCFVFNCVCLILAFGTPALIQVTIYVLQRSPSKIMEFLQLCGNHSLELYLVHEFIFYILMIHYVNCNPWILLTVGFLLSFILAYLSKKATTKIIESLSKWH